MNPPSLSVPMASITMETEPLTIPPMLPVLMGILQEIDGQRRRNEGSPAQCSDGIDNDGDGKIDYEPALLDNGSPNPDADKW